MVIGQDQITGRRRLIQVGREADLVTNFAQPLLERTRQRVRRVRSVHEQQRNATRRHVRRQRGKLGERIRRPDGEIGAELHERSHSAHDVVQDIHCGDDLCAVRILHRHATGDGEPAARSREFACEPDNRLLVDADQPSDGTRTV